jgi:predicted DNA-binding transcriptional regulator AlpA
MFDLHRSCSFSSLSADTPASRRGFFYEAQMKLALDAKELADALGLTVSTVQQYASKSPEKLPPRLNIPGRRLLWAAEDVELWVNAHRQPTQTQQDSATC